MSHESHVSSQLLAALDQGRRLLESIDEELYTRSPTPIATSTVGEHFRHVLDGLVCLLDGIETGSIDYDRRARDEAVETRPAVALAQVRGLAARVRGLEGNGSVRVRADVPEELGADAGWNDSTVDREVLFGLSHTIHHFALIAMILRFLGGEPPEGFGVAPSTLRYWKEVGRCAPVAG